MTFGSIISLVETELNCFLLCLQRGEGGSKRLGRLPSVIASSKQPRLSETLPVRPELRSSCLVSMGARSKAPAVLRFGRIACCPTLISRRIYVYWLVRLSAFSRRERSLG